MIQSYEIRRKNGEEILFLEVSFNQEFAKLNVRNKKKKLKQFIKDYIKKEKINFKGTKVAILASGVLIGTILLINPLKETLVNPYSPVVSVLQFEEVKTIDNKKDLVIDQTSQKNVEENETQTVIKEEKSKETVHNSSNTVKKQTSTDKSSSSSTKQNESVSNINLSEKEEKIEKDINRYVTIHRKNGSVIQMEIEEYLIGVVAAEMPTSFHSEALKAQAVIARTYALKAIERNITLTDTSSTQNYNDTNELKNKWGSDYNLYYQKIKKAILETKDLVLTYNGELIDAVYHSTSNGKTENSDNVWKNAFPYLVSVDSPYDTMNKSFEVSIFFSYTELSQKLGIEINLETNIEILEKTIGDRVKLLRINNKEYTGVNFRNLLGLRSADFEIIKEDMGVKITTKGYGHGVGLSQYGANGMAQNGKNYETILRHYYQGVSIKKM